LREDALRRDFTMNALYADQTGRVIDPTGGLPDARAGRIRFIENPHDRIREDHLRILRFFRFSAWYGNADLGFDADVLAAIADLSDGVLDLSKERVGQEMLKLLVAPNPVPAVAAMSQIGVLSKILPGADPQFLGPLVHLEEQSGTQPDPLRRLAALGGMDARENLRLSKSQAANLDALTTGQGAGLTDKGLGHVYGAETGWSILLLLGAVMSVPVDPHRRAEVAAGATLKFPIRASDLPDHLEGRQIGDTLKKLKADWLASDLNADKSDLLG
ncbi:MAG: CCA tRNA nucleotidyltransferase, partial [Rhodobacteraceae bacterium]|nr:CCA tRNA nucleotidyltransferase [Paracoccaceae bacterium]